MRNFTMLAAVFAGTGALAQPPEIIDVTYYCERGVTVPVTYINAGDFDSVAVIHVDGRQVAMRQIVSASGAKYAALDEQAGYRWWSKGSAATLRYLAADHTAEEVDLLRDCIADDVD